MTDTIIAVYGSPAQASRAVRDLRLAGIPADAVRRHESDNSMDQSQDGIEAAGRTGFWASLLGVESGADDSAPLPCAFVIVDTTRSQLATVIQVLELHQPLDMDEWGEGCRVLDGAETHGFHEASQPVAPTGSGSDAVVVASTDTPSNGGTSSVAANDSRVHRVLVEMPVGATVTLRSKPAASDSAEDPARVPADAASRSA